MKLEVRKEIKNLYYLSCRYGGGNGWDSQKTFVRISYKKKDNTLGSKMYCCSCLDSLLFDNVLDCVKLKEKHECYGERVRTLEYKIDSNKYCLEEIEVEGIKCYQLISK